ncbi:GNAT family N-acetyltransferase [Loktanella sp. DJP18]|uniref:GNAT family N-acetyltransferase n=1 Tax=Loktanella sp. DJP18 TaxID=3409788 RepID=UPI003BB5CED5
MIRDATADDAAAIAAIWNPVIRDTAITFNPVEKTAADVAAMIAERGPAHGFLVADDDGVLGFATYAQFRGGAGYRHTAEHTVILNPRAQGRGMGRALMDALCAHAKARAMHSLFAGCSAENMGAVRFHEIMGFARVAVLPQVGRKFDRWIDLILLQKML